MKIYTLLASILATSIAFASATADKSISAVPGFGLKLGVESYLTSTTGILSPAQIINTPIGSMIKIYRTDGFCYQGQVTQIEESDEYFKIYGTINNVPNTGFGFALAKGGIFAGAVVERDDSKVYTVEFSELHKGYVLMRSAKHEKI
jgi:hypothetical protein